MQFFLAVLAFEAKTAGAGRQPGKGTRRRKGELAEGRGRGRPRQGGDERERDRERMASLCSFR